MALNGERQGAGDDEYMLPALSHGQTINIHLDEMSEATALKGLAKEQP